MNVGAGCGSRVRSDTRREPRPSFLSNPTAAAQTCSCTTAPYKHSMGTSGLGFYVAASPRRCERGTARGRREPPCPSCACSSPCSASSTGRCFEHARAPLPAAVDRRGDRRLFHRPRRQRAGARPYAYCSGRVRFRERGGQKDDCLAYIGRKRSVDRRCNQQVQIGHR
jgi:hypothetical protein